VFFDVNETLFDEVSDVDAGGVENVNDRKGAIHIVIYERLEKIINAMG
jgi:hypothetical protein